MLQCRESIKCMTLLLIIACLIEIEDVVRFDKYRERLAPMIYPSDSETYILKINEGDICQSYDNYYTSQEWDSCFAIARIGSFTSA